MTGVAGLESGWDVASAVLLLLGSLTCLLGAIGLVRLPDLPGRLQAATKPQTLGLLLVLIGAALRVPVQDAVTLLLVALFQALTAPVVAQLVGRAAYRSGSLRRDLLVVDELDGHGDGRAEHRNGGDGGDDRTVSRDGRIGSRDDPVDRERSDGPRAS